MSYESAPNRGEQGVGDCRLKTALKFQGRRVVRSHGGGDLSTEERFARPGRPKTPEAV